MPTNAFCYPINIRLNDIDAAGVMFFAQYLHYAHDAYETFMGEIGFPLPELVRQNTLLPLVRSEADYLLPVRHGDRLNITLGMQRIGNSSFTVGYRFLNQRGEDSARLITTHVLLNPQDLKPMELPVSLREKLTQYTFEAEND